MHNVRRSLQRFSNLIADESLPNGLEHFSQSSTITDAENSSKSPTFSPRAIDFLEKFDKRKYNTLVELSDMKIAEEKCNQPDHQRKQQSIKPEPTC